MATERDDSKLGTDPILVQPGTISYCPHQGCNFHCCEFQQGNYIVMYPGELEAAEAAGKSIGHLTSLEPYNGGFKCTCRAADTATCDNGYKPLDCKSYPFFPTVDVSTGAIAATLKGAKCPLTPDMVTEHRTWVSRVWSQLAERTPSVRGWLAKVSLVGYDKV